MLGSDQYFQAQSLQEIISLQPDKRGDLKDYVLNSTPVGVHPHLTDQREKLRTSSDFFFLRPLIHKRDILEQLQATFSEHLLCFTNRISSRPATAILLTSLFRCRQPAAVVWILISGSPLKSSIYYLPLKEVSQEK